MVQLKLLKKLAGHFVVLYVEDDLQVQHEMQNYLENFFKKVIVSSNGEDGLALYKKEKIDLVITDLSMPKMDGIEMLNEITKINEMQEILITTAHSESDYMIRAIKVGVDGYIIKPFDFEQLNYELFKAVDKLTKFMDNKEYEKHLQEMVEEKTSELKNIIGFQKYNYEKTLLSMVEMIEQRDTYTAGHSRRVADYCKMIAEEMDYPEDTCNKIYQAGIMHDIGKVATPDVVLLNPKKLNKIEYQLIQEHVVVGFKLLVNIPMFEELAEIVHSHHERYDGSGYPRGLHDAKTDELAKIMAVADTFDAMTTNRIYKGRKSKEEAFEELLMLRSTSYNPDVVDAAVIALKDVVIEDNIDQLPHTEVEKERFAYFYKDTLTDLFNQDYLEVILAKNNFNFQYTLLYLFSLKKFSQYNKKYGWKNGNVFLKEIAEIFKKHFSKSKIFRIFGDTFIIISKKNCDTRVHKMKNDIDFKMKESNLLYTYKMINLEEEKIINTDDINYLV